MEVFLKIFTFPNFLDRNTKFVDSIHKAKQRGNSSQFSKHSLIFTAAGSFLVAVKIFLLLVVSFAPAAEVFSSSLTEENVVALTNFSRQQWGLPILKTNENLNLAAQKKAEHMLSNGYFSHVSPQGQTPWDFFKQVGYNYLVAGENLAINFYDPETMQEAWMNSPGHRANILNTAYEEVGVGISQGLYKGKNVVFVVEMFGVPTTDKITLAENKTPLLQTQVPLPVSEQVQKMQLVNSQANLESGKVTVVVKTSENTVKVLARYGEKAIMLKPLSDNLWEAEIPTTSLNKEEVYLYAQGYDMYGNSSVLPLGEFAGTIKANYTFSGSSLPQYHEVLGQKIEPNIFSQNFYYSFIVAALILLIFAILVKRHTLRFHVVSGTAFSVLFAAMCLYS